MRNLFIFSLGLLLGGMWVQYRITGSIWGRETCQQKVDEVLQGWRDNQMILVIPKDTYEKQFNAGDRIIRIIPPK